MKTETIRNCLAGEQRENSDELKLIKRSRIFSVEILSEMVGTFPFPD